MLLLTENFVFIVFQVFHELQALTFVHKVLDTLDHASSKVVVRVFSLLFLKFDRPLILADFSRHRVSFLVANLFDQLVLFLNQFHWVSKQILLTPEDFLRGNNTVIPDHIQNLIE